MYIFIYNDLYLNESPTNSFSVITNICKYVWILGEKKGRNLFDFNIITHNVIDERSLFLSLARSHSL